MSNLDRIDYRILTRTRVLLERQHVLIDFPSVDLPRLRRDVPAKVDPERSRIISNENLISI